MKKLARSAVFLFILLLSLPQTVLAARLLVPGGQVIGMNLEDSTVTVADFHEELGAAAKKAGLKQGDRIVKVDGTPVSSVEEIRQVLQKSDGSVELSVLRKGSAKTLHICPVATAEGPKLGVYLKQGVSGIGTVTWYDPQTSTFGALGHSVNTPDGTLLPMKSGQVYSAAVIAVKKGESGKPGQLMGSVTDASPAGSLSGNTPQGVFGQMRLSTSAEPLPAGSSEDVHTGAAVIRSTVESGSPRDYSVEILKIYASRSESGRNMLLKVTDPELLAATGGIVQGMSGSPIIQDGKLVGAVTHVLVNDPTTGYGIFIENMLDAAA